MRVSEVFSCYNVDMNIYFSGVSGVGIGPLAQFALGAGFKVFGSDKSPTPFSLSGAEIEIGAQDGAFLEKVNAANPIDWFVYTSALPADHPELMTAARLNIKTTKRDDFINFLLTAKNLKLLAIAGTHGKTTTTSLIIWAAHQLQLPISYLVGTTLPWGMAGYYDPNSQYLVYEADEFDRNFLKFHPAVSVITAVDYDHPDIYKTRRDYLEAFEQFRFQSQAVINNVPIDTRLTLAGELRRRNATLALTAIMTVFPDLDENAVIAALNTFSGVGRRFEKIAEGVYSDYAHHPSEIHATLAMAWEVAKREGKAGVVAVYEPHQNSRQHEVRAGYPAAFAGVNKLYWLPTYLTREDASLEVLKPEQFIEQIPNSAPANMDENLANNIRKDIADNYLVLLMTAGPADEWLRKEFSK